MSDTEHHREPGNELTSRVRAIDPQLAACGSVRVVAVNSVKEIMGYKTVGISHIYTSLLRLLVKLHGGAVAVTMLGGSTAATDPPTAFPGWRYYPSRSAWGRLPMFSLTVGWSPDCPEAMNQLTLKQLPPIRALRRLRCSCNYQPHLAA